MRELLTSISNSKITLGKPMRDIASIINIFVLIIAGVVSSTVRGYSQDAASNPMEKGLVFNFSDDAKYFVKLGVSMENWGRFIQYNPGTKSLSGEDINYDFDFVFRRNTMTTTVKMDRFIAFTSLGTGVQSYTVSNSPYTSSKPVLYFYDFFGSYEFVPEKLRVGYGLSLYKGLSRYSSATAARMLGADLPMLSAPNLLTTEQLARLLGLFVAGNINQINYRITIGKPFAVNAASRPAFGLNKAADVPNNHNAIEGYISYQFFDREISPLPYFAATHLGRKKLFNIGVGFSSLPKSTQSTNASGDTITHNKFHWAVDLYLDYPMTKGGVLTLYGAFFSYNYGPNYFMNGGVANTLATTASPMSGITEPNFGTGTAIATQIGWLFPKMFGKSGKIQVYYEGNYMFFDALNDAALHHNVGLTYFLHGHNLKFTTQYELRPYFNNSNFDSYKSLMVFKTQVMF